MKHSKRAVTARTYSVAEAAAILGVGKSTLHDNINAGKVDYLKAFRVGTVTRVPKPPSTRLRVVQHEAPPGRGWRRE